jgi:two-component system phosphate regulon sensor histidine kinase PhoR
MARKRLLALLYPYHLLILVLSLAAATLYASHVAERLYLRSTEESLFARARLAELQMAAAVGRMGAGAMDAPGGSVDSLCKALGAASKTRFTVVLPSGKVVGDSNADPRGMANHIDRPEIGRALAGEATWAVRFSDTEKTRIMYIAVPAKIGGRIAGAIRASVPLNVVDESLRGMRVKVLAGLAAVVLIAGAVSYGIARRIGRPLRDLREGVERFEREGLGYRIPVSRFEEVGSIASLMNELAERLDERIHVEGRQLSEQEAVFSSMVEGIVVVDPAERVMRINRSAARFLGVEQEAALGKSIQEVVRSPHLQQFVARSLAASEPIEGDIVLRAGQGELYLQAHGVSLFDDEDAKTGSVIVLNDVTRLQRLEGVRRDFVANVSHELRTPITSIKGFVETLRDGALHHPAEAEKFLEIVAKQADRMNSIIEDLLLLSRVEQDTREAKVALEWTALKGVILEAVQVCEPKARAKDIRISVDCPDGLGARINAALLEQAIINLIDNAIKYSESGRPIRIGVETLDGDVTIGVRDQGAGIEPEHLPRIFERFYRVDKARSRKLGGTGLGLAIVKHIVQAHGGTIAVESAPGAGTTFSIKLPKSG